MELNSKIQLGILGESISYTRSPYLHNLISEHEDINLDYKIFDVPKDKLENYMNNQLIKIDGFNVTIPYKETVIQYLSNIDPIAKKIGAVNTIAVQNNRFYGYNTDIVGFVKAVKLHILNYKKYFPVLIGYGGVSKAVIFGLEELGFYRCSIIGGLDDNERNEMIKNISSLLRMKIVGNIPSDLPILWINATPIGTEKFSDISINFIKTKKNDFLFDLNYSPNPTYLQKWFIKKNGFGQSEIRSINGIYMLIYQGIASEEIWFPKINFVNLKIEKIINKILK